RYRSEREALIERREISGAGDFGNIEFAIAQEPPMARGGIHIGQDREVDPVGSNDAFLQGADDLVVAAGECQRNISGHVIASERLWHASRMPRGSPAFADDDIEMNQSVTPLVLFRRLLGLGDDVRR